MEDIKAHVNRVLGNDDPLHKIMKSIETIRLENSKLNHHSFKETNMNNVLKNKGK